MGFSLYRGGFSEASGELDLKPKSAAASTVRVSVPVKSVTTTSGKLDSELKAADWLDAAKFPTMTFTSTTVTPGDKGEAKVMGDLTLHGITKPVNFAVTFVGSGVNPLDKKYTAGFLISGDIKRSDFGVTKYVPLSSATSSTLRSTPPSKRSSVPVCRLRRLEGHLASHQGQLHPALHPGLVERRILGSAERSLSGSTTNGSSGSKRIRSAGGAGLEPALRHAQDLRRARRQRLEQSRQGQMA